MAGGGTGNVSGPASSTDNAVARFDGAGGKTLQNSVVTVSDAGAVAGVRHPAAAHTLGSGITLTTALSGSSFHNTGATGLVEVELPAATAGLWYIFTVLAAQTYQVLAVGSDTIRVGASVSSAGGTMGSNAVGNSVLLHCPVNGSWVGIAQGTFTLA